MQSQRRHDIDALRVFATLALIIFHTARVFDTTPWHVKNEVHLVAMDILVTFMDSWHMPLFFALAGAAAAFSLRRRSAVDFIKERVLRLFIPFLFGVLLIIPPQVYVERISDSPFRQSPIGFEGSFLQFYPHFFTHGAYPDGNLSWHHLWFICYLFLFSLLLLPLFRYLSGNGRAAVTRWGDFLSKRFNVMLLAVPLIVFETALAGAFPGPQNFIDDLANIAQSMTLVVYGFLLVLDPRLHEAVERNLGNALIWAAGSTLVIALVLLGSDWPPPYSGPYFLVMPVWAIATWSWVLFILALGGRTLRGERAWIQRFGEIAFPFYILHQTAIVVVASFVVDRPLSVALKYGWIAIVSLVVTLALATAAKYSRVTRFILGIKPARRADDSSTAPTGVSRSLSK